MHLTGQHQSSLSIVNWDPITYNRLATPHREWAAEIINRLPISPSDCILDAGCGTGYMTALVAQRTTSGIVIAVDVCAPMLQFGLQPGGALRHPRIRAVNADLLHLPLREAVDGIYSNAVFHWVLDQKRLFSNLFASLRSGGWLVAQTGGGDNMHSLLKDVYELQQRTPFAPYFADWKEPWVFVGDPEMQSALSGAGFVSITVTREPRPVAFTTSSAYCEYLREIVLRPHLAKLPPKLKDEFLQSLAERSLSKPKQLEIDYCRSNIIARKP